MSHGSYPLNQMLKAKIASSKCVSFLKKTSQEWYLEFVQKDQLKMFDINDSEKSAQNSFRKCFRKNKSKGHANCVQKDGFSIGLERVNHKDVSRF